MLSWKLRHPEKGLSAGHPDFDPRGRGPNEWLFTGTVPPDVLIKALQKDGLTNPSSHPSVSMPRAHYQLTLGYYAAGSVPGTLPMDGSVMTTGVANFLPTARGTITLRSADPSDAPIIDPQYLTSEHDLCVLREGMREVMRIMDTPAARTEVEGPFQIPGGTISLDSTDDELDERSRNTCITWFHPAGTAAMGKVVDGDCRVKGVDRLRVVDASIIPDPLGAHYQGKLDRSALTGLRVLMRIRKAPIYAIAEKAAEIIAAGAA